ncbi:MAG: butyrate kinase [Candidatus Ozemobacteraceae bacterium]
MEKVNVERIVSINPGSTSTKIASFIVKDDKLVREFTGTIIHSSDDLKSFEEITDQFDFRKKLIINWLNENKLQLKDIDCFVGRGGFVDPIPSGAYKVDALMLEHLRLQKNGKHPCNLGGLIAHALAEEIGSDQAYIVDPVVVDEMCELARISGMPEISRLSKVHTLNHKAVGQLYAESIQREYKDLNLVIVHMGGGISIAAHQKGKMIDVNNGLNGEGAFTPERTGGLPTGDFMDLCYSGKYTHAEMGKKIKGQGGLVAYLKTNNAQEVAQKIKQGDEYSRKIFEAMAYQVAKDIGAYSAVLSFDVDAVLLTGGLAYNEIFCNWIIDRVRKIAPVVRFPGGDEEMALAKGVFLGLRGEKEIGNYREQMNKR